MEIENITWLRGNMKFISSVEQDIYYISAREINFIFPSIYVIFCLFQKHSQKKSKFLLQTK